MIFPRQLLSPPRPRRLASALLLMWACVMTSGVFSMTIRELRLLEKTDKKQGAVYSQYYLVGAMEGALEVNAHTVRAGLPPMFCLNGRRLEPQMVRSLYDTELKRNKELYEADMPVQLVVVTALATAYPCT